MNLLVISPHPDDETLGAGGTILRYKNGGNKIYWLNITSMKEEFGFEKSVVDARKTEISKVSDRYGFDEVFDMGLKPAGLDGYDMGDLTAKISEVFSKIRSEIVILPFRNDIHSDHKIAFEAAFSCTKVFRHDYIKKILMMEVLSETDFAAVDDVGDYFAPNYFVDISDFLDEKIEIMKLYGREIQEHPFPRSKESIKALATLRGAQSGCRYAEGFKVLKLME